VQTAHSTSSGQALGTGFTYQGQLNTGNGPVNGACDFQFGLHDALNGGAQLGSTQSVNSVSVSNSVFSVTLRRGPRRWSSC
jgi:hypothetical protein